VTALVIGVLHGIGAETPTQVLLFVAAAGASGAVAGELVLVAFAIGLLAANSVIAVAASAGFLHAGQHRSLYVVIAAVTAAFSLVLGAFYVIGLDVLPPVLAG
jgi:high-affinity nickel-transport protein